MAVNDNEGQTYLPRTRKTRALMALLAMSSPKPMLRPQLASLLWSQRENEQARASLRQSVHELQDTLGASWSHVFVTDRHHLSLRGAQLEIDALLLAQPAQISPDLLDQYDEVLLADLNGLDPAFDRWLENERGRFVRIRRTIGESFLPDTTIRLPRSKPRSRSWCSTAGMRPHGGRSYAATLSGETFAPRWLPMIAAAVPWRKRRTRGRRRKQRN